MARPRKTELPDITQALELTAGAIERLTCPNGKQQVFLRDSKSPGLRVRVTAAGAKSFVFEAKLNRQTIRRTIGDVRAWTIEQARNEANRLRVVLDAGSDPRELDRKQQAEKAVQKAAEALRTLTVAEAWSDYVSERKPLWGARHYADHINLSASGGQVKKRGKGLTESGPLHSLMGMKLADLNAETVQAWATKESAIRPTVTRNAWRLLRSFLNWCAESTKYSAIAPSNNPAKARKVREAIGSPQVKTDALQREMLAPWFAAVRSIGNRTLSAYLQFVLLTGCRPGEALSLRWDDMDFKWRGVTIRDKVEGERVIPLPAYLAQALQALPRVNQWVFASPSKEGAHLTEPNHAHDRVCKVAGIESLTLHGLRRSFKSLSEWVDTLPVGVVAQIMGHKPSATAEKHYTVRPLDLLRLHHEKLVAWILEQADVPFDAKAEPGKLRVVANG